eukprot:c17752_g1_i1.p1 GENE.c17752_g1_i1~~c17752_g1_i1.p1  ORF type:complete len:232 (+),score=30.16 c17752_g1_i1:347-1042(+)
MQSTSSWSSFWLLGRGAGSEDAEEQEVPLTSDEEEVRNPSESKTSGIIDKGRKALERTKAAMQPRPPTLFEKYCCRLSKRDRIAVFAACWALGLITSAISTLNIPNILTGHPERFVIPYVLGSVLSLSGTLFLVGPMRQCRSMCAKTRRISALLYLGSMGLSLFFALRGWSVLCLVLVVVQYLAFFWYCLSYVPYGRRAVWTVLKRGGKVLKIVCVPICSGLSKLCRLCCR